MVVLLTIRERTHVLRFSIICLVVNIRVHRESLLAKVASGCKREYADSGQD
jgi:hypothetical protein